MMHLLSGSSSAHTARDFLVYARADIKRPSRILIKRLLRCGSTLIALFAILAVTLSGHGFAQTPSTDALAGVTLDSSGSMLQGAEVTLTNRDTGQTRNTAEAAKNKSVVLQFRVADVDQEYRRLQGLVKTWVKPPTTQPWGTRSIYFRDPDGDLVDFYAPIKGQ